MQQPRSAVCPHTSGNAILSVSWVTRCIGLRAERWLLGCAGYSRILGGIHFHNDNIRGRQTGTAVGWQVRTPCYLHGHWCFLRW